MNLTWKDATDFEEAVYEIRALTSVLGDAACNETCPPDPNHIATVLMIIGKRLDTIEHRIPDIYKATRQVSGETASSEHLPKTELTDEEIFDLADQYGWQDDFGRWNFKDDGLISFALALMKAEREACAKVCDQQYFAYACVEAIRARGEE